MQSSTYSAKLVGVLVACVATYAVAAEARKELRYNVARGASINIENAYGAVILRPSLAGQIVVTAIVHSPDKVEVDADQHGNRIELRSHFLQKANADEGRVDYEILVPPDSDIGVRASTGPIRVDRLQGDFILEGDAAQVDVRESGGGHVHVRTISGPITLTNIANGHTEITTVSGDVNLTNVTGPRLSVSTSTGNIRYEGDFAGAGDYSLTTHSGELNVLLPESASVDVLASSVNGTVQNDFPLRPPVHSTFHVAMGKSFAGTSNLGLSKVYLRSFSGKIRVKKKM